MHFGDALKSSFQSILNHKMRSLLTLLGIVIGVMAVVSMFSSVYALKALIKTNMEGMGWNYSIIIVPGNQQMGRSSRRNVMSRTAQNVQSLSYEDYELLRDETDHKAIYGMIEKPSMYRLQNKDIQVTLRATGREFFQSKNYNLLHGRYFNQYENDNLIPVAVLGYYFAEQQYGERNPVGEMITISGNRFRIVGVLDKDKLNQGQGMNFGSWERQEDLKAVYVPLSYGARYLSYNKLVGYIYLQAASEEAFGPMKSRARQLLLSRRNMYPNFSFMDIGDMMLTINKEIDENMKKWNITLFAIASISLIVGGIGLFSTLLISIQERMMEIGVRKSIGATEGDIFSYFILEAITLALLGALMGVGWAWLALVGLESAFKIPMYLPMQGVLVGFAFSLLIGFISGLYPAIKASKIDPIQAIYYFE